MVYLKNLEKNLLEKASDRDKALYYFLRQEDYDLDYQVNDVESELCHRSFKDSQGIEALNKLRKAKEFKGFYYANNIVLLIAAANIDFDSEEDNLKKYLKEHSYKEQFIINQALKSNIRVANSAFYPVQILAKKIEINESILEHDIQNSLSLVDDLYDYFIVEKAIVKKLIDNNIEKNLDSYLALIDITKKSFKRIEIYIYTILLVFFVYILFKYGKIPINLIIAQWDDLEPIAFIITTSIQLLVVITGVVITTKIRVIRSYLRKKILSVIFWLLGVNYEKYENLLKTIKR